MNRTVEYGVLTLLGIIFVLVIIAPAMEKVNQSIINSAACISDPPRACHSQ